MQLTIAGYGVSLSSRLITSPSIIADIYSGTLGLAVLLAIMFTLGDLSTILASPTGQPLPEIFLEATGSHNAAFDLFFLSE